MPPGGPLQDREKALSQQWIDDGLLESDATCTPSGETNADGIVANSPRDFSDIVFGFQIIREFNFGGQDE